jgi:TPR repeat protein
MLRDGRGTPANLPESERFFRLAADRRHPSAVFELATMLQSTNSEESDRLLQRAQSLGSKEAAFAVGRRLFDDGDEDRGLGLIRNAAVKGHTGAMEFYAIHEIDHGRDCPEVMDFLQRAAQRGHVDAMVRYAQMLDGGVDAMRYMRLAAEKGSVVAQCTIGRRLLETPDSAEGIKFLRRAVAQGSAEALFALAGACPLTDAECREFAGLAHSNPDELARAADTGNGYALYWLGTLRHDMDLIRRAADMEVSQAQCEYAESIQRTDIAQADKYMRMALEKNASAALVWFGRIQLESGNRAKGISYFRRAASQGNVEAQCELGRLLIEGKLQRTEVDEAHMFLRKAGTSGHALSMFYLGKHMLTAGDEGGLAYIRAAAQRNCQEARNELAMLEAK